MQQPFNFTFHFEIINALQIITRLKNICFYFQPPQHPAQNDYEIIRPSYKITSPATRPAPKPPVTIRSNGTLCAHSDVEGVPFVLNPSLSNSNSAFEVDLNLNRSHLSLLHSHSLTPLPHAPDNQSFVHISCWCRRNNVC